MPHPKAEAWTPGPWRASGKAVFAQGECIALTDTDTQFKADDEANAHLIAASPDLYAACKAALTEAELNGAWDCAKQIDAALRRAQGEG